MENCVLRAECDNCKELYDEKIGVLDHKIGTLNHRVDTLEDNYKQINSLTVSIEKMAVSVENMTKELERQGRKLDELEAEPAKKWKQAVWIIISVSITAVVTMVLYKLGLK